MAKAHSSKQRIVFHFHDESQIHGQDYRISVKGKFLFVQLELPTRFWLDNTNNIMSAGFGWSQQHCSLADISNFVGFGPITATV